MNRTHRAFMAGIAFVGVIGWLNRPSQEGWSYKGGIIRGPLGENAPIAHVVSIQGKGPAITQCSMKLECKDRAHNPECPSVIAFRARAESVRIWREIKDKGALILDLKPIAEDGE